jgi:undecaprenyl-diphosphatase
MPAGNNHIKTPLLSGRSTTWIILSAALLLAVIAIWFAFLTNDSFDQKIFDIIAPHISSARTRLMLFISFFGNTYFMVPANLLLLLYFILKKNRWWSIRVAIVSLTSLGLMSLIKTLVHRHRPPEPLVSGITNFSFPSGHAFMSVAFYGLLAYGAAVLLKKGWLQQLIIIFFILFILLIGFSRIYLRVHYTTDVIAGLGIGTSLLILSLTVLEKIQAKEIGREK